MGGNYAKSLYKDYAKLTTEHESLRAEHELLAYQHRLKLKEIERLKKLNAAKEAKLKEKNTEIKEKDAQISALKNEVARLSALREMDSNNSGLPTAKTPIHKKKRIPNSRPKTTKPRGGQTGHAKHKLKPLQDCEITEHESHEVSVCPDCGGELEITESETHKDEIDYEVIVRKIRHHFPQYHCLKCGKTVRASIPPTLKEETQYGPRVKALALALGNDGNVSMKKISRIIYGLSEEGIRLSDGFIAKLQRWAKGRLSGFCEELKKAILRLELLYWDDTVIMINKRRGCLRFYGDERLALYKAHERKDKKGLDEDGILALLPRETKVMHDHNRVNYNADYSFTNVECNVHLLRDLEKVRENLGHEWAGELRELLVSTDHERNEAIARGERGFSDERVKEFFEVYDRIMLKAVEENRGEEKGRWYVAEERALILRILKYKDNYLCWVTDFEIPFSNNQSERALRGAKSKMKMAGQFWNVGMAESYAAIRSYIATCHLNGINAVYALERLCGGNPLTLDEILSHSVNA